MDEVDVLVIGAGAAGSVVASALAETKLRVLCLEQGNFTDPSSYPGANELTYEQNKKLFNPNPNIRQQEVDYPINDQDSPISIANYNAVGGSTILFSGHFPRMHPSDFRVKTLDGVADDWPISYSELEPYYDLVQKHLAVAGVEGDPAYPRISNLLPPVPLGKMGETLAAGFNKLNWHWWPSYSAIATRPFKTQNECINFGSCNTGCPIGAKSSADVVFWRESLQKGVKLKTNSRVKEIVVDANGLATGVYYYDQEGMKYLRAKVIVLACNGVGTPRLLLNSKSSVFPNGLGNSTGLVGKNLMLHPLGYVEGHFENELDSNFGPQGCSLYSHEFYESDISRGFLRGYTMQALRGPALIDAVSSMNSRKELRLGSAMHNSVKLSFNKTAHLAIIVEDLPDPLNRVELDTNLCDSNGIPAPKITYKLSENSRKMMAHGLSKAREVMIASGATKTMMFGPVRETGWHLMGTARMGDNPDTSVVNKWGQLHESRNVYIADSSIFVTSSGVNPANTIQALAFRTAEKIYSYFSEINSN